MRRYLIAISALMAAIASQSCGKEEVIVEKTVTDTIYINKGDNVTYDPSFSITGLEAVKTDIRPIELQKGDVVAVCATSNAVTEAEMSNSIEILRSWGLTVIKADNLYERDNRYAGTIDQRVKGLQAIINNPEVRAIFMARGGYGTAQILPYIDWRGMYDSPKWVIGYSDVSALHFALNNMGFETIHGPMMKDFSRDAASTEKLKNMLFGKPENIEISTNGYCVKGKASGRLVGGNLSLLQAMSGTAFDLNTIDAILFIEDTGENNYSIDRMLLNMQQSGKLEHIKGVIVGDFIGGSQGIDLPINQIIQKYVGNLNVPVVYGIKTGHDQTNLPLMLGSYVNISVDDQTSRIEFSQKPVAK